jgi:hypothetical protein
MAEDESAIASLMAIELDAERVCDQRLQQRLTLGERKTRDVATIKMQKIEGVIDELHVALGVGRGLGVEKLGNPASSPPQSSPSR